MKHPALEIPDDLSPNAIPQTIAACLLKNNGFSPATLAGVEIPTEKPHYHVPDNCYLGVLDKTMKEQPKGNQLFGVLYFNPARREGEVSKEKWIFEMSVSEEYLPRARKIAAAMNLHFRIAVEIISVSGKILE